MDFPLLEQWSRLAELNSEIEATEAEFGRCDALDALEDDLDLLALEMGLDAERDEEDDECLNLH